MDLPAASELVLRITDLPGDGWVELDATAGGAAERPSDAGHDGSGGADLLGECLGEALDDRDIVDSADSPAFRRPPADLAYSTAVVFVGPDPARRTADLLTSDGFVRCFAAAIAGDVEADPGSAELLGSTSRVIEGGPRMLATAVRTTFVGASAAGVIRVHLDLLTAQLGPALVITWLAGAPEPVPRRDRAAVVDAVQARMWSGLGGAVGEAG